MDKDYYTKLISLSSDRYENQLIEMLDKYNENSLRDITKEEAKEFYENLIAVQPE